MSTLSFGQHKKILRSITGSFLVAVATATITLTAPMTAFAEGETISGGTNVVGNIDTWLEIDGISVSGTTEDPISVSLSVDSGNLRLTNNTGITYFDGVSIANSINITGSISDINNALGSLQYLNTELGTVNLTASLTAPGEVYYPENGHVYELVFAAGGITAEDARVAAEARTRYGSQGYLATITSQAENDYVGSRLTGDGWFAASDAATEGDWKWLSGPDADTSFWSGAWNGSPVSGRYSSWSDGEPNNGGQGGNEDCGIYYNNGGGWNDISCSDSLQYYVVEYGVGGDLPTVSSTDFTISTVYPVGDAVTIDSCEDITTIENNPLDYRYDNISLTQDIDCAGATIAPMFSTGDEFIGSYSFRGTFDGNGYTINNLVINEPYEVVGLIRHTNGASFTDVRLGTGVQVSGVHCVGGLVGEALNSTFTGIASSAVTSSGEGDSGGIVGCINSDREGQSAVSDSTTEAMVFSSDAAGGIVGNIDGEDISQTILDNNTSSAVVSGNRDSGGIVGETNVDNESSLTISNNTNSADIIEINDSSAGIAGYIDIEESASVTVHNNSNSGLLSGGADAIGGIIGRLFVVDEEAIVNITSNTNSGDVVSSDDSIGGIIGYVDTDHDGIEITMSGSTNTGNIEGDQEVGGLVGVSNSLNISNSSSTGDIMGYDDPGDEFQDSDEIGGLVGDAESTVIENSFATGRITGDSEVGGLVGYMDNDFDFTGSDPETGDETFSARLSIIRNSYFEGDVEGNDEIGGLVGDNSGGLIERSYADAAVTGVPNVVQFVYDPETGDETYFEEGIEADSQDIGGLVGEHETDSFSVYRSSLDQTVDIVTTGKISESFALGTVSGGGNVGGIAGNLISGSVTDSYARSSITMDGSSPLNIGGAIGRAEVFVYDGNFEYYNEQAPSIDKIYATGLILSTGQSTGGLVGRNIDNEYGVTNSFWDTQTSGINSSVGGTGKTSAEMKTIETYINLATSGLDDRWNFNDVWGIYANINNGYPCLSWSSQSCDPNSPDADEDGISDSVEAGAPNNGDANNDGTPDSQQTNVASFVNSVSSSYVVLQVSTECSITEVGMAAESTNSVQDSGFAYPVGLMNFRINCGTNGYTANVRKIYYGVSNTTGMIVRKYNPNMNAYFNLTGTYGATIEKSVVGGQAVAVASYQVTDGQELDIDSTVNGEIVDPVGLALSATGSPNTGLKPM